MIKCSCRCYCSHNRGMLVLHYQQQKWSKIKKKKYNLKIYNLRDHQNSPIDTVADTGSTVIGSKNLSFWDNWEKIFFSQLQLVFLLRTNWFWFWWVIQKCLEIGKNQKKNYMAADGHTNNFQGLVSFLNIMIFFQKI